MTSAPFRLFAAFLLSLVSAGSWAADPFPLPDSLKPAVDFWTRVYTESNDMGGYIHDDTHLNVVYARISFPKGASRKSQQSQIKKSLRRWRTLLLNMSAGKRSNASPSEQKVLALWGRKVSRKALKNAAYRLRFQRGQSNKFRDGIIRSGTYVQYIGDVFRKQGLPATLGVTLPHVESSFTPHAHSHVGAAGLWQFTRSTGRRFMRIDHVVDERLDPFTASHAAAKLLQHNYNVLKHWPLAITAYNHGLAGMRRAVRTTGSTDIGVIVHKYKGRLFGFASRNFYAAFLAAKRVSSNPKAYFGVLKKNRPAKLLEVTVPAYLAADDLSRGVGISKAKLKKENPALRSSVWRGEKFIPKNFTLRLPSGSSLHTTRTRLARVSKSHGYRKQKPDRYYRVQRGDSLGRIAKRYGTSVSTLMNLNKLRSKHRIHVGQRIRLPGAAKAAPQRVAAAANKQPATHQAISQAIPAGGIYRVQRGDNLAIIARRFNTSVTALKQHNALRNPNKLRVGQKLIIPDGKTVMVAAAKPQPKAPAKTPSKPLEKPSAVVVASPAASTTPSTPAKDAEVLKVAAAPSQTDVGSSNEDGADEGNDSHDAPVEAQPDLSADPADYRVSSKGTIEVQAAETLGHYAEWLDIRASDLRKLNRLRYKQPLTIGKKLKLDFRKVKSEEFESRRLAYHRDLQADYFDNYRITGTKEHKLRRGDSLWQLAVKKFRIPLWLLRQYNPDVDLNAVLPPGGKVQIPLIESIKT